MPQRPGSKDLNLSNLNLVARGAIARAFDHCLRIATQDIIERPGDKGARKVVLEIELKPVLDQQTAVLDTITHKFRLDTRIPKRVSPEYPMLPMAGGRTTFQPNSPGDPRQMDLYPDEQAEARLADGTRVDKTTGEVLDETESVHHEEVNDEADDEGNTNIAGA